MGEHAAGRLFEPEAFGFYERLAADNTREWFSAHREEYDGLIREPLEMLCEIAEAGYSSAKVFRPNRDVRFSADKSPYKTNAAMVAGTIASIYLSVSADGIDVGGGLYQPSRGQLRRGREAIEDDATGSTFERIADDIEAAGFTFAGPPLKTAPRGYDREHPRIVRLRLTHYAALRPLPREATVDDIQHAWQQIEPLRRWIVEHVGPSDDRPFTR